MISSCESGSIPVSPNFPACGLFSTGPESTSNITSLAPGNYTLEQVVTINLSGLIPGESVDILLPEPASCGLIGLAAMLVRRQRK